MSSRLVSLQRFLPLVIFALASVAFARGAHAQSRWSLGGILGRSPAPPTSCAQYFVSNAEPAAATRGGWFSAASALSFEGMSAALAGTAERAGAVASNAASSVASATEQAVESAEIARRIQEGLRTGSDVSRAIQDLICAFPNCSAAYGLAIGREVLPAAVRVWRYDGSIDAIRTEIVFPFLSIARAIREGRDDGEKMASALGRLTVFFAAAPIMVQLRFQGTGEALYSVIRERMIEVAIAILLDPQLTVRAKIDRLMTLDSVIEPTLREIIEQMGWSNFNEEFEAWRATPEGQ